MTVNGQGIVSMQPDRATISLNILTTNEVQQTAVSDNNSTFNDLRNRLHAAGIDDAAIRTVNYSVNYSAPPRPLPAQGVVQPMIYPYNGRTGYTASRQVQIQISNLDLVGKAVDAAAAANVSNVYNVAFSSTRDRAAYSQALGAAVADAGAQAQAMASAAHMHVVRIASMQTGYYSPPMIMRSMGPATPAPMIATQIAPSAIDVRATVTITYVIAP